MKKYKKLSILEIKKPNMSFTPKAIQNLLAELEASKESRLICPQTALDVIPLWTSRSKEVDDLRITVLVWHRAVA